MIWPKARTIDKWVEFFRHNSTYGKLGSNRPPWAYEVGVNGPPDHARPPIPPAPPKGWYYYGEHKLASMTDICNCCGIYRAKLKSLYCKGTSPMNNPTPAEQAETRPVPRTAISMLNDAAAIQAQRAKDYDQPGGERSMAATVTAFNAITKRNLTESEGFLIMQILKDVRDRSTDKPHFDSLLDGVSYSSLKAEARLREGRGMRENVGKLLTSIPKNWPGKAPLSDAALDHLIDDLLAPVPNKAYTFQVKGPDPSHKIPNPKWGVGLIFDTKEEAERACDAASKGIFAPANADFERMTHEIEGNKACIESLERILDSVNKEKREQADTIAGLLYQLNGKQDKEF